MKLLVLMSSMFLVFTANAITPPFYAGNYHDIVRCNKGEKDSEVGVFIKGGSSKGSLRDGWRGKNKTTSRVATKVLYKGKEVSLRLSSHIKLLKDDNLEISISKAYGTVHFMTINTYAGEIEQKGGRISAAECTINRTFLEHLKKLNSNN